MEQTDYSENNKVKPLILESKSDSDIVETQYYKFTKDFEQFNLENGETISSVTIAYETYGALNPDKSNAILITHGLSGDAHASGYHKNDKKPGWWDSMIGPGKAFDTDKYFIVSSNVLGGCQGSTGPSSVNPEKQKPYGLDFPLITIGDMVNAQRILIDHLGIEKLLCVAGGSMGGMQVLKWLTSYPERVKSVIPIATTAKHSPQQIAFNEVGRQAIFSDPNWDNGNYYDAETPARGLALARMIAHITYMSDQSMLKKFGRQQKNNKKSSKFTADFEVEGYLHNRGDNFVSRFDANSYLYITKAMDNFDLSEGKELSSVLKGITAKIMIISFKSDWLYPNYQSRDIVSACKRAGLDVTYCEIESSYGHDSFLVETKEQSHVISHFLKTVNGKGNEALFNERV